MVLQSTGTLALSQIQTEFGGTNPIYLSEYYTNASGAYTTGVSGLPATGAMIACSSFFGKAKPVAGNLLNTTLQNIYNALQPYLAEYKNANFYEHTLDGDATFISDGGLDMYDGGNYTQIMADGVVSGNVSYSTTSESSIVVNGKSTNYISLGYARPLIMLAKSTTRASWGFQKTGNLGADGGGSWTNYNVYTGNIVNGFTVYAWCRHVYGAGDPSIGDLYFAIGDSSSTFYTSSMTASDPGNTDNGLSSMRIDCVNALFGCILCSKPSGTFISAAECQTVLTNFTSRLKAVLSTSITLPTSSLTYGSVTLSYFSDANLPYMNSNLNNLNKYIAKAWSYAVYSSRTFSPICTILANYGNTEYLLYGNNWESAWWLSNASSSDSLVIEFDQERYVTRIEAWNFDIYGQTSTGGDLTVYSINSANSSTISSITLLGTISLLSGANQLGTVSINKTVKHLMFFRPNATGWSRLETILII